MQSAREKEGVILGRQGDMCTIHAAYVALLHELFEVVYAFRLISEREISAVAVKLAGQLCELLHLCGQCLWQSSCQCSVSGVNTFRASDEITSSAFQEEVKITSSPN